MKLNLIVLGKLKEEYWKQAEAEYLKRLTPYAKINIIELKEESFSGKDKPDIIKEKEAGKILNTLSEIKDSYIITLDEHGKQFSSVDFAKQIFASEPASSASSITFIIGGPLGLDQSVLDKANLKLSLSSMTFTHQMARVFLVEQLYRSAMINAGRTYHF